MPSGGVPGHRIVRPWRRRARCGSRRIALDHARFAVVEPFAGERAQRLPADLAADLRDLALADPRGAEHRQVVAAPLLGNADAHLAHAEDVLVVPVVLLDLDRRKDQRAFVIDVARRRPCRWWASELPQSAMCAFTSTVKWCAPASSTTGTRIDVIGGVRVAVIGRVVQERVARCEHRVELLHRTRHQVGAAQYVDRIAFGGGNELVVRGHHAAGEVARRC